MDAPQPQFLDVSSLLETSQPRGPGMRLWYWAGLFMLVVLVSTYLSSRGPQSAGLVSAVSGLLMLALLVAMPIAGMLLTRRVQGEQMLLESIEELIRLRRWPEAAGMLDQLLGRPTRTPQARAQGLIFLTAVLARYNRFSDAITVQNYLLDNIPLDPGTAHGMRLGRAMAMLHEDRLFDADRAINELRRRVTRAGRANAEFAAAQAALSSAPDEESASPSPPVPEPDPQTVSAGLVLVEIYRDVKTGHPAEAIATFNAALPVLREQLGHRVGDVYALVARAYDLLGDSDRAAEMYRDATLLAPPVELHRRYPETALLAGKYQPADAPRSAA